MYLRTFHMPAWMDEELRMLSGVKDTKKAELMRRMLRDGLKTAWKEIDEGQNTPHHVDIPLEDRSETSEVARKVVGV